MDAGGVGGAAWVLETGGAGLMWLHIPTSHFSPEPEASTSPSDSLCQRLAQSATWKTKSLPPKSWQRELKKGRLTTRLSGLMCEPSRADFSVAAWLESLEDSHVPTSALPAAKPESLENVAASGSSMRGLFAKLNHNGFISKMSHQSSMWEMEEPYSENLPSWGSMRNGELYQQQPWAPRISESEFSSWPTARSEDAESCGNHPGAVDSLTGAVKHWPTPNANPDAPNVSKNRGAQHGGERRRLTDQCLSTRAQNWPTPDANASSYSNGLYGQNLREASSMWSTPNVPNGGRTLSPEDVLNRGRTAKGKRQVGLENEASLWATPQAHDQAGGNPDRVGRFGTEHGGRNLADDVTMWATPTSAMTTGAGTQGRDGGENLQTMTANWPMPQSRDWKSGDASEATTEANARPLNEAAERWNTPTATDAKKSDDGPKSRARREAGEMLTSDQRLRNQVQDFQSSHQDQLAPTGKMCFCGDSGCDQPSHKRKLNPLFATWLMGWPIWWCMKEPMPYAPSGMASWLSRARRCLGNF